jgi:hypothetical protein
MVVVPMLVMAEPSWLLADVQAARPMPTTQTPSRHAARHLIGEW